MGMEFSFDYDAEDKSVFEVPETVGYTSLVEFNAESLKKWGLWTPFVEEYRGERQTMQEWMETTTPEERTAAFSSEPPDEEEMEALLELGTWGPSQPFDPQIARDWASRWIMILDLLTDEEAEVLFPFNQQLHKKDRVYGRDYQVEELQSVINQADCAARHGVGMTMSMFMD